MRCPHCDIDDDRVIDSRSIDGGASIRRRRQCNACGRRYTTYERVEKTGRLMVVKKDGTRVPFDPQKVLQGVQAACGKRPIPEAEKVGLVRKVEDEVHREHEREVASLEIGRRVAAGLRELDPVAYIRYASEYHSFRTIEDFRAELAELEGRPQPPADQLRLFSEADGGTPPTGRE
ncbi:MAG: transcriptional regulator NrdR [Planctomycetota bacterium]|jgi:transcriptional repressor NrdR